VIRNLFDELRNVREELATLSFQKPNKSNINAYRAKIEKLKEEKERLEAQLMRLSQEYKFEKRIAGASIEDLIQNLPKGSVLIDFTQPQFLNFQAKLEEELYGPRNYLAFLIFPAGEGSPQVFNLGKSERIDNAITSFRREIQKGTHPKRLKETSLKLHELIFGPLKVSIEDRMRIFISPEGGLNLVSFEALVQNSGRYLVEDYTFSYVTTGRDVLRFSQATQEKRDALILADPDFDLKPTFRAAELRKLGLSVEEANKEKTPSNRSSEMGNLHFSRLPMTKREGQML